MPGQHKQAQDPNESKEKQGSESRKSNGQTYELEDGQITAHNTSNPGTSVPANSVKGSAGAASIDSAHSGSAGEEHNHTRGSSQLNIEASKSAHVRNVNQADAGFLQAEAKQPIETLTNPSQGDKWTPGGSQDHPQAS